MHFYAHVDCTSNVQIQPKTQAFIYLKPLSPNLQSTDSRGRQSTEEIYQTRLQTRHPSQALDGAQYIESHF